MGSNVSNAEPAAHLTSTWTRLIWPNVEITRTPIICQDNLVLQLNHKRVGGFLVTEGTYIIMGLTSRIIKRNRDAALPSYLNQSLNDIEIKFDVLNEEEHARFGKPEWSVRYGLSPENLVRNRYRGVVPWDKTRVKLPVTADGNDYINASWVTLTPGGDLHPPQNDSKLKDSSSKTSSRPSRKFFTHSRSNSNSSNSEIPVVKEQVKGEKGLEQSDLPVEEATSSSSVSVSSERPQSPFSSPSSDNIASKTYIVTQGPLNSTIVDFWQMVNEYCGDPAVIIMLTGLSEPYKGQRMNKCARYWPVDKNVSIPIPKGENYKHDLSVRLVSLSQTSYYELRELEITNVTTGTKKAVHHFYYNTWPDFGNPSGGADMVNFVSIANAKNTAPQSPLVVHCSAGIGRSGTYLAIDAALTRGCWVDNERDLVYDLVSSMRQQRLGMVQKATQLEYIYLQIKKYLNGLP
ncbi:tyrosine protein phosphatase PTP1 [Sugiyamaella lignohabitans]|uniref:Tyrosine protein phosphatase PTP1 n=1 Tax=Sugiyamaella lignohabitans TaxID=796027 RepID=A0A167FQY2_9ASCO|nr:tyrosine protein phosphatase PTP1 [Sugiyamaella lignohabitans]ANB15585.1 tyrosine protein phosphatase PTP1 [Sugiyamaella lignohabitans]